MRVLFVCTANICRSPYAEARALQAGLRQVAFASAGTLPLTGASMDDVMELELRSRGGQPPDTSRGLSQQLVGAADLILTMTGQQRSFVIDSYPRRLTNVLLLGQAARASLGLAAGLAGERFCQELWVNRGPEDCAVPDPIGQGPAAAHEVADQIDAYLTPLLNYWRAVENND